MIHLKKILVPVDFSDVARHALHYAASFCAEYGAELHLLHVIEEEVLHPGFLTEDEHPEGGRPVNVMQKWEQEGMERLDEFAGPLLRTFELKKHVQGGLVHEGILTYAQAHQIDLIVMGAHGNSGYIEAWLGGTAYEVARKANCPVLTVKPNERNFVD